MISFHECRQPISSSNSMCGWYVPCRQPRWLAANWQHKNNDSCYLDHQQNPFTATRISHYSPVRRPAGTFHCLMQTGDIMDTYIHDERRQGIRFLWDVTPLNNKHTQLTPVSQLCVLYSGEAKNVRNTKRKGKRSIMILTGIFFKWKAKFVDWKDAKTLGERAEFYLKAKINARGNLLEETAWQLKSPW